MPGVAEVLTLARTALGDLRGTVEGGVAVWRGVPYAEQPVGDRRFAAPATVRPWTGVREAVTHAPLPPQSRSMVAGDRNDPKIRDEACLTVTIWSPDPSASLPVMVWIPGGAFLNGAGQLQLYNGSRLSANGNVVVVNVTYRVGVFGGFELGSLGDGFDDNLCLRDQIAALNWVRDHIAAFGGDADRVTVFSESAGATSVLALMASPAATGLFARAIAQSPALPLMADRNARAEQAARFLDHLGTTPAEVKALPQRELRRAAGQLQLASVVSSPTLAHGLTYGVDLLPRHPVEAARAGATARIPLIIGSNRREAALFARDKPPMLPTTPDTVDRYLSRYGPQARARLLAAYPGYPRRRTLETIGADAMFVADTWAFADAHSAVAPTYAYRFDHAPATLRMTGLGAVHGSEIVHILRTYDSHLVRRLHPLGAWLTPPVGRRMQRAWLEFATAGGEVPLWSGDWPRYDPGRRATRVFRTTADAVVDDPDGPRRAAWQGIG
ncbi:carboxylesterase/lipase family protein [Candidatus Mycobacterium wuenschmannii]|uniref:Carboxylesterase/lipase family protein n=1 Tax=Candidatus Mycobacterium wuenschmannii TaxID=3027808 RepID=A0ABY8VYI6_9MYCO|nr:carboxylesterase/lipase family protein [Candidatus Mycobacterium wuenschmannii]WIM88547.1 carboxylesterase/lipase family protein [Candidatus Mycobacterium wuenschmannii]